MAKKEKRVSINAIDKVPKYECEISDVPIPNTDVVVAVKSRITLTEIAAFVENVAESCFDAEEARNMPYCFEPVFRANVLSVYGNLAVPKNVDKLYDVAMNTSLYSCVITAIDDEQLKEVRWACVERIKYMQEYQATTNAAKFAQAMDQVEQLTQQMQTLFAGLDANDFQKTIKNVGKMGKINEASLAQAVAEVVGKKAEAADAAPVIDITTGK